MKRCVGCGKTFGLIRRGVDLKLGPLTIRLWDSGFHSKECESQFYRRVAEKRRFQRWLYGET